MLLPFVLALVLAYVLMPLVSWVERWKMPRGAAIVLVYVVVLGSFWLFVRGAAPRMSHELRGIRGEIPQMVDTVRDEWVPAIEERLRRLRRGRRPRPTAAEPAPEEAAFVARPRPDGSLAIEIGSGVSVSPTGHGGYEIAPTTRVEARALRREQARSPSSPSRASRTRRRTRSRSR